MIAKTFSAAVCGLLMTACGGNSSPSASSISSSAPSGKISGSPWTMTNATVQNSGGVLSVSLFDDSTVASCGQNSSKPSEIFSVQNAVVGTTQLNLSLSSLSSSQTVTFTDPTQNPPSNDVAASGVIDITALSATSVSMGLDVTFDSNNNVNGSFTATLCPSS